MKLYASNLLRLYAVGDSDENGDCKLEEFDNGDFNETIDAVEIDTTLRELTDSIYGRGDCFEITNDMREDDKIVIELDGDDRIEIRDVRLDVDVNPEDVRFFVSVNAQRSEYQWIVAASQGTTYLDWIAS